MYKAIILINFIVQIIYGFKFVPIPLQIPTGFAASTFWDEPTQSLYFIDLFTAGEKPSLFRYDYKTGKIFSANIVGESMPSFFVPVEGCQNEFIVGLAHDVKVIQWDGASTSASVQRTLFKVAEPHMNLALTDQHGRLYVGTFDNKRFCSTTPNNTMYRFSKNQLTPLFNTVRTTNGIAINRKTNKLYQVDSCEYTISEFDYDPVTGDICNGRVVFDFKRMFGDQLPPFIIHGLEIDRDGRLYACMYEGGEIWIIDVKKSRILRKIQTPSKGVSAVTFGGPNLDQMFVTSGNILVNVYTGALFQNRTDPALFMIDGYGKRGYKTKRVRLQQNIEAAWSASNNQTVKFSVRRI